MSQKFIRDVTLRTDAGVFEDLKIGFSIEKTVSGTPNPAKITVWNLSASSRAALSEEDLHITLDAGYVGDGSKGIIFDGYVRDAISQRVGVDVLTEIEAGDGDRSHRKSYISKTFSANTPVLDMVKYIQTQMADVDLGEIKMPENVTTPVRPTSFMAPPQRCLNELGRTYGFYWSIQNGALEIIPVDGYINDPFDITPHTGMIGTPSKTDSGIIVTCLLSPDIRPNRIINVQSDVADENGMSGEYRVSSTRYEGDNRDGDFFCEIEAELINDGKVVRE